MIDHHAAQECFEMVIDAWFFLEKVGFCFMFLIEVLLDAATARKSRTTIYIIKTDAVYNRQYSLSASSQNRMCSNMFNVVSMKLGNSTNS